MPRRHRTLLVADALREVVLACSAPSTRPGASAIVSLTHDELHALVGKPTATAASTVLFLEQHLGKIWAALPVGWTLTRARGVFAVQITRREAERVKPLPLPSPEGSA